MKGWLKGLLLVMAAFAIAIGFVALHFRIQLYGKESDKKAVQVAAKQHIETKYQGKNLDIEEVSYDFKSDRYKVWVQSKTSRDTVFSLYFDPDGNFLSDDYDRVLNRWTTAARLDREYNDLVSKAIGEDDFSFETSYQRYALLIEYDDAATTEHAISAKDLELDKSYDIKDLGKEYGALTFHVDTKEIRKDHAEKAFEEIKAKMQEKNIPFYCVDIRLEKTGSDGSVQSTSDYHFVLDESKKDDLL